MRLPKKHTYCLCPGWEDSTMGNIFTNYVLKVNWKAETQWKSGGTWHSWQEWYTDNSKKVLVLGGGGIALFSYMCDCPCYIRYGTETPFWVISARLVVLISYGSYSRFWSINRKYLGKLDIMQNLLWKWCDHRSTINLCLSPWPIMEEHKIENIELKYLTVDDFLKNWNQQL
jgi:hypothetical protein